MGFFRQEYWNGLPLPPPGDLPEPGIKSSSLTSPALAKGFFTNSATQEAPHKLDTMCQVHVHLTGRAEHHCCIFRLQERSGGDGLGMAQCQGRQVIVLLEEKSPSLHHFLGFISHSAPGSSFHITSTLSCLASCLDLTLPTPGASLFSISLFHVLHTRHLHRLSSVDFCPKDSTDHTPTDRNTCF